MKRGGVLEEATVWSLVGGLLGLATSIIVGIIGYFLRQTLIDIKEERRKHEKHIDSRLAQIMEEVKNVEMTALEVQSQVYKSFGELPSKFVPRLELQEIVRSIRATSENNHKILTSLGDKIDQILLRLIKNPD